MEEAAGRTKRILVVDDDAIIRATLRDFLQALGHQVSTAENGRHAVDILDAMHEPPQLLITDIAMPVMDGIGLIRHVRQHFTTLPIAVFSGHADDAEIAAAGIHDTVRFSKPMDFAQIARFLDQL